MVFFFYTWVKKEIVALQPLVQERNTMTQPGLKLIPRQLTIFLNVLEVQLYGYNISPSSLHLGLHVLLILNILLIETFNHADIHCLWLDMIFLLWFSNACRIIILIKVEGFYANKKKSRTKKYLLEWSQKAAQKASG